MSTDGFTAMIDEGNAFFTELRANNTKEWFNPRKDHYNEQIKKPAEFFSTLMADDLSRITGQSMTPKVFRIYRDVRFSKDKTPLNAHLHILWSPIDAAPFTPFYFFGSEPGSMSIGFGVPSMKGEALTRYRAFVDAWGDLFEEAIEETGFHFSEWGAESLKRVPKPYDPDHPHAELLKRKGLIFGSNMDEGWREAEGGLLSAVRAEFEKAEPLRRLFADKLAG